MGEIDTAVVDGWQPAIHIADGALDPWPAEVFVGRVRDAYEAPAVRFDPPESLLVTGRQFVAISAARGLVPDSVHMLGRFRWTEAFADIGRMTAAAATDPPPLVAANAGHENYYHWTVQSLAAVLAARALDERRPPLVVPRLDGWRRDGLALFGIDNPLIELAPDEGTAFDRAVLTNLTGGDYAFAPHPAVLGLLRDQCPGIAPARTAGSRVYLARLDAGKRRMTNEAELCALLADRGFRIVAAGALPLAEQIALFRTAELIVAPHGAALANLVYARDGAAGPRVVELLQANYLNRCFLKIGQAKRLDYTVVVNPCVSPGSHHHNSTWRADLPLLERVLDL